MSSTALVAVAGTGNNGAVWVYNESTNAWDLIVFDTRVRTSRLEQMASPLAPVGMNSQRLVSLADPVSGADAATKAYVDASAQGLNVKASVRVTTTVNITLSGVQTIDGIAVIAGDRVLVKDQTTGSANGIYVVAAGAWSRAADADTSAEVTSGMFTFVNEGTLNADSGWVLVTNNPITLGTTALSFTQFSGAGQLVAGAALTRTGNTLDAAVDNATIEVNADALRVKPAGLSPVTHIAGFDTQVRTSRLDQMAAPTAAVAMGGQKITGLGAPTVSTDAATKQYVDTNGGGGGGPMWTLVEHAAPTGTTETIDLAAGNYHRMQHDANLVLSLSNVPAGLVTFRLHLYRASTGTTAFALTLFSGVRFVDGAPTMILPNAQPNAYMLVEFVSTDGGSTWSSMHFGNYYV